MADTKISALTAVTTPALTDEFAVNQGGASKKATLAQVRGASLGVFNVKDYGALGDDTNDDTAEIHAARDAAGANGTVYFPPGTYKHAGLTMNVAGQRWVLAKGATLKQAAGTNAWTTVDITAAGCVIEGGTVDCNGANNATSERAIVIQAPDCTVRGMTILNTHATTYGGMPIQVLDHRGNVIDCLFPLVAGHMGGGIFVQQDTTDDMQGGLISGNVILNNGAIGSRGEADVTPGKRVVGLRVIGNYVEQTSDTTTAAAYELTWSRDITVVGNTSRFAKTMGFSFADCEGVTFTGNTVADTRLGGTCGIEFTRWAGVCANNVVDFSGTSGGTQPAGLMLSGGTGEDYDRGLLVSGNIFRACRTAIVAGFNGGDRHVISDNVFTDCGGGTDGDGTYGIKIDDGDRWTLRNNVFHDFIGTACVGFIGGTLFSCQGDEFHNVGKAYASYGGDNIRIKDAVFQNVTTGLYIDAGSGPDVQMTGSNVTTWDTERTFSVKAYGAKGDDTATDTTAIHAARDAAGTNGEVYFPPGTYKVGTLAANVAGQTWRLAAGATIKSASGTNAEVISVTVADFTLCGEGKIDGNVAGNGTALRTVWLQSGADRATVRGLEFINFDGYAIQNHGDDVDVLDCYIHGADATGIFYQGQVLGGHIRGNHVALTGTTQVDCIAAFGDDTPSRIIGLIISDNRCIMGSQAGLGIEVKGGTGLNYRVIVSNNYVESTAAESILGISMADTDDAIVQGNILVNAEVEVGSSRGAYLGNVFDGTGMVAIGGSCFSFSKDNVEGNTISGNTMRGFRTGINFQYSAKNTSVVGNTFAGQGSAGVGQCIAIQASTDGLTIVGNTFTNTAGLGCITVDNTPTDILIEGNRFDATSKAIRSYATGAWGNPFVVRGNIFTGVSDHILHENVAPTNEVSQGNIPATDDSVLRSLSFIIDGGGSVPATGDKGALPEMPFAGTIVSATLVADASGSCVVDVKKSTYSGYPGSQASICASAKPTLSGAQKSQDTTLTGWTKTFAKGDVFGFNLDSATTVKRVTLTLVVREGT